MSLTAEPDWSADPKIPQNNPALPPGPWEYWTTAPKGDHPGKGHIYIVDAQGRKLGALWGTPEQKMALAAFILEARNGQGHESLPSATDS